MDQDSKMLATKPVQRLCSEIQLFDLCDLGSCNFRSDRFCCNSELLSRFEQIAEDDISCPKGHYMMEELEDEDELGYPDNIEDDFDDEELWEG